MHIMMWAMVRTMISVGEGLVLAAAAVDSKEMEEEEEIGEEVEEEEEEEEEEVVVVVVVVVMNASNVGSLAIGQGNVRLVMGEEMAAAFHLRDLVVVEMKDMLLPPFII
jgi:hypothetical protein